MGSLPKKILLIGSFLLFVLGYAGTSAYAKEDSESPIHELPRADRCSIIMMNIRKLASSLKDVEKKISPLESQARPPSVNNEHYEKKTDQDEHDIKALQEKASSLRKQIDKQEQLLESCFQHETAHSGQND
jgi:peptidoglycan hydrolase CwlO-like protein